MKKILFTGISLILINMALFAQFDSIYVPQQQHKLVDFTFSTGTSISSFKGYGNAGTVFFAPGLKIAPTPKLNIEIKTIIENPTFNTLPFESQGGNIKQNQNISLYAEGEYKFSEKLHMKGSVYKNNNQNNYSIFNPTSPFMQYMYGVQNAYSVGLYYNITRNLQVGAEIQHIQYTPLYFPNSF